MSVCDRSWCYCSARVDFKREARFYYLLAKNAERFMRAVNRITVSQVVRVSSSPSVCVRAFRGSKSEFLQKAPDVAYQRRVIVTLNLRERKPPIRAKATCGQPSMTTATKHWIGMETKGWCGPVIHSTGATNGTR